MTKIQRTSRELFKRVMKKGRGRNSKHLSLKFLPLQADEKSFVAVVSKKNYKRAVDRNKLKRRARAIFRKLEENAAPGSYILFLKSKSLLLTYQELEKEVADLIGINK
ncbi:MAG TPA: ribonuclease P protein component [Candidatus Paceibacterota bacterium]|nr:ribonuclease P protein component [Candidatus Paceibacterota bacterium]